MKARCIVLAVLVAALVPGQTLYAAAPDPAPVTPPGTTPGIGLSRPKLPAKPHRRKVRTIWRLATGLNFSRGTYGGSVATEVVSAPLILRVRRGRFSARASVPFLSISGPATIVDTGGPGGNGGPPVPAATGVRNRSGLGDLSLGVGYSLPLTRSLVFDATGRIKFPTASRLKRLTTGSTDVIVQADLSETIGRFSLHAAGRHRFSGHGDIVTLRDTWGATGGFGVSLRRGLDLGVDYDWQQSSIARNAPDSEVPAWAGIGLTRRIRMSAYGSVGTSTNSPNFAAGTSLSLRLD